MQVGAGSSFWYANHLLCSLVCTYLTISQEGLLTIVVAALAYFFISNYPSSASWLSLEEKSFIHARLKADSDATNDEKFTWDQVWVACKDIKCWLYGLAFHTMSLPLYTLSLFLVRCIILFSILTS
jgi:hypothetical protein